MKFFDRMKGGAAIICAADHLAQNPAQVKADIEEAIAAAWASDDPAARLLQDELFPGGRPSPEEFVSAVAKLLKK